MLNPKHWNGYHVPLRLRCCERSLMFAPQSTTGLFLGQCRNSSSRIRPARLASQYPEW